MWREWWGPFLLTPNKELYQEKEDCDIPKLAVSLHLYRTRAFLDFPWVSFALLYNSHLQDSCLLTYIQHVPPSMAMLVTGQDFLEYDVFFPQALGSRWQSPGSSLSHPAGPWGAALPIAP